MLNDAGKQQSLPVETWQWWEINFVDNCQGMAHSDAIDLATVFDKTGSINFFNIMSYLDISEP